MGFTVVVDTNVLVGALIRASAGSNRRVLRLCLEGHCQALMGGKLFLEFESVLARDQLFERCPISSAERAEVFEGFAKVCRWVSVHYLWRPNLPDEGDNHLLELAVAGGAECIITQNVRDLRGGELQFPQIQVLTPGEFLRKAM
jgi:putative PIN family toxin of toxin-antitoxin system